MAYIELTGRTCGRLTVVKFGETRRAHRYWDCLCSCGRIARVSASRINTGKTLSCGCLRAETTVRRNQERTRHGHTTGYGSSPEYVAWRSMRARCYYASNIDYSSYGGRGITVCERWQTFDGFLADMGHRPSPGHTLDRYPDNDGNYEPGNCRWATARQQGRNRRTNHYVTVGVESYTIAEWSERKGVSEDSIRWRLKNGWNPERAVSQPARSTLEGSCTGKR